MTTPTTLTALTQDSDYDPNSMPVAKAREYIRAFLQPITGTERLNIRAALGRVLAEDVVSALNVPAHDNSAMDGYAFRHADLGTRGETTLNVIGTSFAGRPFVGEIESGQAVRIMTGAVMPKGADTVVMQERVKAADSSVTIPAGQQKGQNVRPTGGDIRQGDVVFPSGQLLRAAEIGMLASLGIGEVGVYRRLRVA
ncbi:MAG TPA: molybdopterin molybdotransferase MoeA, partial [Burkholderiales bacterium]|nr:molybdopterin molybdotransferase MoeA [Burkholderiales bacterium]